MMEVVGNDLVSACSCFCQTACVGWLEVVAKFQISDLTKMWFSSAGLPPNFPVFYHHRRYIFDSVSEIQNVDLGVGEAWL